MKRGIRTFSRFWAPSLLAYAIMVAPLDALDSSKTLTQYAHRIWGQEEGLLQPTIYSILQSHDGFLWLGTQDSLIRFDGIHFREFEGAAEAGLQRTLIRSLAEDSGRQPQVGGFSSAAGQSASVRIIRFAATQKKKDCRKTTRFALFPTPPARPGCVRRVVWRASAKMARCGFIQLPTACPAIKFAIPAWRPMEHAG